jgi:hypothetical protein
LHPSYARAQTERKACRIILARIGRINTISYGSPPNICAPKCSSSDYLARECVAECVNIFIFGIFSNFNGLGARSYILQIVLAAYFCPKVPPSIIETRAL